MRYMVLILSLFLSSLAQALTLLESAPSTYVVQPGDTLWSISSQYLSNPWEWKALWRANPKIKNPNKLYPGAVIELDFLRKNPYLKVLSNGTIKLSPYMRPMPAEDPIPPIPLEDIRPFLDSSLVLDRDTLSDAPYVVAFQKEHLVGGQGDEVYVKNLCPPPHPEGTTLSYGIYRPCGVYTDPDTKECLGFKATMVGYAELLKCGDPATIMLTDIIKGVEKKDRVMPNNYPGFDISFEPKAPNNSIAVKTQDLSQATCLRYLKRVGWCPILYINALPVVWNCLQKDWAS